MVYISWMYPVANSTDGH